MNKSKTLIIALALLILGAVLFGIFMAYKTYKEPMYVENLEKALEILTSKVEDEKNRIVKLALYNELSNSKIMIDRHTNERKKFTNEEMQEIYSNIGGKEAVLKYLRTIQDDGERRNELQLVFDLKIIDRDELDEIW